VASSCAFRYSKSDTSVTLDEVDSLKYYKYQFIRMIGNIFIVIV